MGSFRMKAESMGQIDGRRVLQPAGNRVIIPKESTRPIKKLTETKTTPPSLEEIHVKKKPLRGKDDLRTLHSIPEEPAAMKASTLKEKASKLKKKASGKISDADSSSGCEEKRCSFVAPNSDPVCIKYHDEEWGVPVHDDKLLFELLVMAGAQAGLDWTTILKKRENFRSAFAGFDPEIVVRLSEREMVSISSELGMDLARVRGVVDNAKCILQVREKFGSFADYLWRFVNKTPISTQYKNCRKIPVKTSKSEAISKDMIRRGFRLAGSTVILSFMQAAGLTNDHLLSCSRHDQILQLHTQ